MELHKKKETQWSINKKDTNVTLHLKSIEEAGVLTNLLIGVKNEEKEIFFEMNPSEFDNFFAILKSFKNLLISRNGTGTDDNVELVSEQQKHNDNQSIEDTTKKALDDLRQKEKNTLISDSIDFDEEIEVIDENQIIKEAKNQINDNEIDTEEIFSALDTIEPSVEPGKNIDEKPLDVNQPTNQMKMNDTVQDQFEKKGSKDLNPQKLDPKEWDPW